MDEDDAKAATASLLEEAHAEILATPRGRKISPILHKFLAKAYQLGASRCFAAQPDAQKED